MAVEKTGCVLVLDDDPQIAELLGIVLETGGHSVIKSPAPETALKILASGCVEVLMLDVNLPGMSGMDFLKIVKHEYPGVETIVISGDSQLDSAISFVRAGAFDFLPKPIPNAKLLEKVEAALAYRKERLEMDMAKTAQFMVDERPLAKYIFLKNLPSASPLCDASLLERDFDSFVLNSYKHLFEISPNPDELSTQFISIVQKMQTLEHPNVAKIIEYGFQDEGTKPYVVLENVKGRPLVDLLGRAMDVRSRLRIARQIASTVSRIHECGMLLGTLSASFIMIDEDAYNVKFSDFGLASLFGLEARKMRKDWMPQTSFIAPELRDDDASKPTMRSDAFALGAILYAILCDLPSFPGGAKIPKPVIKGAMEPKAKQALSLLLGALLRAKPEERLDSDEALSTFNVASTMPDMLDLVLERYDLQENRELWA